MPAVAIAAPDARHAESGDWGLSRFLWHGCQKNGTVPFGRAIDTKSVQARRLRLATRPAVGTRGPFRQVGGKPEIVWMLLAGRVIITGMAGGPRASSKLKCSDQPRGASPRFRRERPGASALSKLKCSDQPRGASPRFRRERPGASALSKLKFSDQPRGASPRFRRERPGASALSKLKFSDQPRGASLRFRREGPGASALRLICRTRTLEMDRTPGECRDSSSGRRVSPRPPAPCEPDRAARGRSACLDRRPATTPSPGIRCRWKRHSPG